MESIELKMMAENPETMEKCTSTDPPPNSIVIDGANNFGPNSQLMECVYCGCEIRTKTVSKVTERTHLWALLLCCLLCWPCVCVPYLVESCRSTNHYCPKCDAFLGSYGSWENISSQPNNMGYRADEKK